MVRLDGEVDTMQICSEMLDGGNHCKAFKLSCAVGMLSWLQLTAVEGDGVSAPSLNTLRTVPMATPEAFVCKQKKIRGERNHKTWKRAQTRFQIKKFNNHGISRNVAGAFRTWYLLQGLQKAVLGRSSGVPDGIPLLGQV